MKIFAKILPDWLGRAMHRINEQMRKYAPSWIEFVDDYNKADLQILDVIGPGSFEFLYLKDYILVQHCICGYESSVNFWKEKLIPAKLILTYLDLPPWLGFDNLNICRLSWGADPNIFYKKPKISKKHSILTTGYVAYVECIDAAYNAVSRTELGNLVNIGEDFKFGNKFHHYQDISDEKLNELYNASYYVLGARKIEGFELPILEGLLCGARGICLDYPIYKYWYGDLVEYINDGSFKYISDQIYNIILNKQYRPVTQEEIEFVKNKFNWETIMTTFWKEVEKCV